MSELTDEISARYVALTMLQILEGEHTNQEAFRGSMPRLEPDEAYDVMQRAVGTALRSMCEHEGLDPANVAEDDLPATLMAKGVLAGVQVGLLLHRAYCDTLEQRTDVDLPSG